MNRKLVEQATHPEALDALTKELAARDLRWQKNRQDIEGNQTADAQIAAFARLDWGKAFYDEAFAFPSKQHGGPDDGRVGTRLGAQDLAVKLPEGTIGPFGVPVKFLSIPNFWFGSLNLDHDVEPRDVTAEPGGFTFYIQNQGYRYCRLGLNTVRTKLQKALP